MANRVTPILKAALEDRSIILDQHELDFVSRFLVERLAKARLAIVPDEPTKAMQAASMGALRKYKRPSVVTIGTKQKHRHRIKEAVEEGRVRPLEAPQ